ncbi:hypothetical protein [Caminicella sporogenes]|uniref:hypothetical protein n=1 Tax=Caminicella sporogenes TaxID=166485 RepID=UPI002541A98D|nr:hypothetical protein [Caminicella sporogenes]WIF95029.1 hypothetical protein QNI18_12325 [Caminicella sporogenes]
MPVVKGFCPIQNKDYQIYVQKINTPTLDNPSNYMLGVIECNYASLNNCELANTDNCPLKKSLE